MGFGSFLIKRILVLIPLMLGMIVLNFALIHVAPGNPVHIMAGEFQVTPEYEAEIEKEFGLDKSLPEQLLIYVENVLSGNLGYSYFYRQPVVNLIIERIPATILLSGLAVMLSSVGGVLLGTIAGKEPNSKKDRVLSSFSLAGYSVPVFWLGQIAILVFAVDLRLFPMQGMLSLRTELSGIDYLGDVLRHVALPALVFGLVELALIFNLTRVNIVDVMRQDFIVTARCKGLSERLVVYRHALRNAILPVVTVIAINVGRLISGAILVETVFGWPGLGRLTYESMYSRDYPVLMGLLLVFSITMVTANFITDILYHFLDPRIELG